MSYSIDPIDSNLPGWPNPPRARRRKSGPQGPMAQAKALLKEAREQLHAILQDEAILAESPLEAQSAIQSAAQAIDAVLGCLESNATDKAAFSPPPGGPTRQQGQFLAFIREYIMRNEAGLAPSHADLQRFFKLTPPSVNSMLIRLEQRGFIRRIPGQARAIEIICPPAWIPPLDQPFKL